MRVFWSLSSRAALSQHKELSKNRQPTERTKNNFRTDCSFAVASCAQILRMLREWKAKRWSPHRTGETRSQHQQKGCRECWATGCRQKTCRTLSMIAFQAAWKVKSCLTSNAKPQVCVTTKWSSTRAQISDQGWTFFWRYQRTLLFEKLITWDWPKIKHLQSVTKITLSRRDTCQLKRSRSYRRE